MYVHMNIYVCNNNEKGYEFEGKQGEFGGVKGKGDMKLYMISRIE